MTPLYGYNSQDKAYLVNDYPYGLLRCRIKFWLERHPTRGFRFCSQTENPKNGRWNNPRHGTYFRIAGCMYLDEHKHVQCSMLSEYLNGKEALQFIENFPKADMEVLRAWIIGRRAVVKRSAAGEAVIKINGVPQMPSPSEIEKAKEELDILAQCHTKLSIIGD